MALESWKVRALGIIPPYFTAQKYLAVFQFFSDAYGNRKPPYMQKSSIGSDLVDYFMDVEDEMNDSNIESVESSVGDFLDEDDADLQLYTDEELDEICTAIPEVIDCLERAELVKVTGDTISMIEHDKIGDLYGLFRFARQSIERRTRWTCYYLYNHKKFDFTLKDIAKLNQKLELKKIRPTLEKIIAKAAKRGLLISLNEDLVKIAPKQEVKFVGKCLVDEIELLSRTNSYDLEQEILLAIDKTTYSNKELAMKLMVDESTSSRVLKRLQQQRLVSIVGAGDYGRQYWMTNCDNCPWAKGKEECRANSISTLQAIFKEKFSMNVDDGEFDDLENQSLLHLLDIFRDIPRPNNIELKKRKVLNELLKKALSNLGLHYLTDRELNFFIEDKKGKVHGLDLPPLFLLGINFGSEIATDILANSLRKAHSKSDLLKILDDSQKGTRKKHGV